MSESFVEKEVKILDVDVGQVAAAMSKIGAKKVYDDFRTISTWDLPGNSYRLKQDKLIRITEEDGTKITMHINNSKPNKTEIKFKTSIPDGPNAFLTGLGLRQVSQVKARRVSWEFGKVDFDLDIFPKIPAFLEIDRANLSDAKLKKLLALLGLQNHKVVVMGTEAIHKLYKIDYFKVYKSKGL